MPIKAYGPYMWPSLVRERDDRQRMGKRKSHG